MLAAAASIAQEPASDTPPRALRFETVSLERALSDDTVNGITQDRQGYLWVATFGGVDRYDGYTFELLGEPASETQFPSWRRATQALMHDRDDRIWIGTDHTGLYAWDIVAGELHHWPSPSGDDGTPDAITHLVEARDGTIWIGTRYSGLHSTRWKPGGDLSFEAAPALGGGEVRALVARSDGALWIGTTEGLFELSAGALRGLEIEAAGDGQADLVVTALAEGPDLGMWVGTESHGVFLLDEAGNPRVRLDQRTTTPGALPSDKVQCLFVDPRGGLWIGTDRGLVAVGGDGSFQVAHYDPFDPASLSDDSINTIFQDRAGVLWIGTRNGGLNKLTGRASPFAHIRRDPADSRGLGSNRISAVTEDPDGRLWIGTFDAGMYGADPRSGGFSVYRGERGDERDLETRTRVMSMHFGPDGSHWIGTLAAGLLRRDPSSGRFDAWVHDAEDPTSLSYNGVTVIRDAPEGDLWVGTYRGGLNRFDPDSGRFERFPIGPEGTSSGQIRALVQESPTVLWVGTGDAGLNRLNPETGAVVSFRHDPVDPESLGSDAVMSLLLASDNTLWIGTESGLAGWRDSDREAGRPVFEWYGEDEGLLGLPVWAVLEDERGHLWASTLRGLSRFDPRTGTFTNFGRAHGLPRDGFKFGTAHAGHDGTLYFGSNSGVTYLDPAQIAERVPKPPIVIHRVLVDNEPVAGHGPGQPVPEVVEVGFRSQVVAVELALLDYLAPDVNRFEYRLEGFDEDWIELRDGRRATFANLPAGRHTLHVRGANSEGIWSSGEARLVLDVQPAPWATWWAYALYGTAGAALIVLYGRRQGRKLDREAEYARRLEVEVHARTRALEEQNERLQYANRLLEIASVTDSLTGVRNRRFLLTNVERDIALLDRTYAEARSRGEACEEIFAFLLVDLDGFKAINDRYGHSAGDLVLFQIRDLLTKACRSSDTLVRWGGDEFMIVGRATSPRDVDVLADRVRDEISGHSFEIGAGEAVRLTCSIGFAGYPFVPSDPGRYSWEEVVELADKALFHAKSRGPGTWTGVFGTPRSADTPLEDLLALFSDRPDLLAADGSIVLRTSEPAGDVALRTGT